MNMKSTEAKVGAFVVISAVILAVGVYYVSKASLRGKQVPYKMYLRYAGGLQSGTDVLFGGITVGKVTAVEPDPEDPTRIEIDFQVKPSTPINAKSVAKLGSVSLMSNPVLSISTGSRDAPRLQAGSVIPSQETISMDEMARKIAELADSAQNTIASVQTDVNNITGDARHLLANLNNVTGKANQEHVSGILTNADNMVAQVSPKMGPTVDNINKTVLNANKTMLNADGTITAIREPVQVDLEELRKTLVGTHVLVGNLQSLIQTNDQNITYTLENVRMATDNLNDLTESVKQQPWSLIRIKQPKEREVPK
jgi:phospholipid/cholesterol/gamma-HCH transport system substrate-binding protein